MTDIADFETALEARLRTRVAHATRPFDAADIARSVVAVVERPRGHFGFPAGPSRPLSRSWVALGLVFALAAAITAIGALLREPAPVPPKVMTNGWIAFTVGTLDRNGHSDIFIVRPGVPERVLIGSLHDEVREVCPQFSPDGTRLAYLSGPVDGEILGRDEIRVASIDGNGFVVGAPQVLAGGGGEFACPEWSPDSQTVAAMTGATIWISGLDGGSRTINADTPMGNPGAIDWSPDGTELAYVGRNSLWIAPLDGGPPRLVYEGGPDLVLGDPAWSPEGTQIAVTATSVVELPDSAVMEDLPSLLVPVDGSGPPIELPDVRHLLWSPDGRRLAAERTTTRGFLDWNQLVTMAADGSDVRIIDDTLSPIRGFTWSPDSTQLLYVVDDYGRTPGLLSNAAAGDGEPRVLLTRPYWLEYTTSDDLSWQAVFVQPT